MASATDECKYLDKKQWWLNELESLGISPKKTNQLNDKKEISNLAENIKQTLYHEYKIVYNEK
jgi:DNA repair ATPase RecN